MGEMVLHGHELGLRPVDAQMLPRLHHAAAAAPKAAVAVDQRIERSVRRIPVPLGVAPTSRADEADGRVGKSNGIHFPRAEASRFQAIAGRLLRHAVFGMLVPYEALLLSRRHQLAVHQQRRGGVVAQGAGEAENDHAVRAREVMTAYYSLSRGQSCRGPGAPLAYAKLRLLFSATAITHTTNHWRTNA